MSERHYRIFIAILKEHSVQKAVVHCFTGTQSDLKAYLGMGFYIGITGWICDERRGKHLRDLVRMIPPDRLMIETDAPFLTPRDLREKPTDGRNEPAFLPHILQTVAQCVGRPAEEVAKATTEQRERFSEIESMAPDTDPSNRNNGSHGQESPRLPLFH